MISGFFEESIIKRAVEKKIVEIEIVNLRDFAIDDYGTVDDRPYGGGTGMVIRIDVIYKALADVIARSETTKQSQKKRLLRFARNDSRRVILTSPKGKQFNQKKAQEFSKLDHLIIVAGHYEGVDERVLDYIDEEVSMGDFVLTGGEIVAAAITDSVVRLLPGVLKKDEATKSESFNINSKKLLEYPQYTRPKSFKGLKVPKVLQGGNHKEIEKWRLKKATEETRKKRPDLLKSA